MKFFYIILFIALLSNCISTSKNQKYTIITSIAPIASLIQEIGGDTVQTTNLIPIEVDPHTFSLKPSSAIEIAQSDLVIALDDHFDGHFLDIADVTNIIVLNPEEIHHNPHIWLSFTKSIELADKITKILIQKLPKNKILYQKNNQLFKDNIRKLYKEQLNKNNHHIAIIQQHPVWNYMAKELGIPIVGVLEENEGVQVSAQKITNLINVIKTSRNKIILIGDAFNSSENSLKVLVKETGVDMKIFNPLLSQKGSTKIEDILKEYGNKLIQN